VEKQVAQKLWTLIEPLVAHQGYEVVDVEVHGNRNAVVRIFLDGPNGVNIDKCAEFARQISDLFDVEDPIRSHYHLEVSSPGVNRPLRLPKHFLAQVGQTIALKVDLPGGKVQKLRGKLVSATDDAIEVEETKDRVQKVKLADIITANLIYAWDNGAVSHGPKKKPGAKRR
jgi:ribosome maturation factor RimP